MSSAATTIDAIVAALDDRDRARRNAAIEEASRLVDPERLVVAMADNDNSILRNSAMSALSRGGARSIPALIRALEVADPEVATFAATLLGRSHDPSVVPHLVRALDGADINVVQASIEALAHFRAAVAVDAIARVLDRDPWLRFAGVTALGEIGAPRAVAILVPLLEDEIVRDAVVEALGKIGTQEAVIALAAVLRENGDPVTFGACVRAIDAALADETNEEVLRAASTWVWSEEKGAALQRDLATLLAPDGRDFDASAETIATKGAVASIVRALRLTRLYAPLVLAGRHESLFDTLGYALVAIGPDIAPALVAAFGHHRSPHIVRLVCHCVGALGLAELATRIEALLRHEDERVVIAAILALARMQATASIPAIASLLKEASPEVRLAGVNALAMHPPHDVSLLEPLLLDPSPSVRRAVILLLVRAREPRTRALLLAQIERDAATRLDAINALAGLADVASALHLVEIVERENEPVRIAIVEALGVLLHPIAEPGLVRLLADPSEQVRAAAVRALVCYATPEGLRRVVASARDESLTVRMEVARVTPLEARGAIAALERLSMDRCTAVAEMARRRLAAS